jgi:hypothetical protein
VVVRNPWRTYRVRGVREVRLQRLSSPPKRAFFCCTFIDARGRAVKAVAMTVWTRGLIGERPGRTAERLYSVLIPWTVAQR